MAAKVVEQGSPEWEAERTGKMNASTISVWEGKHPHMKPEEEVRAQVRALSGAPSEFELGKDQTTLDIIQYGTDMEDTARKWFEKEYNKKVWEAGGETHPDYPFLRASPDGLVDLNAIVEFKVRKPKGRNGKANKPYSVFDPSKIMYYYQIQMNLEVFDREICYFVCYISPELTKVDIVHREPNWLQQPVPADLLPKPRIRS